MRSELQREIDEWLGNVDDINDLPKSTLTNVVDMMLDQNLTRREAMSKRLIESYSPVAFALEFCTIRCDFGRSTGKSMYIRDHADDDSLIVIPKLSFKHMYKDAPYNIVSANQIKNGGFRGSKKYKTVYVDEPHDVFKVLPLHELYHNLVDYGKTGHLQTFIILGA